MPTDLAVRSMLSADGFLDVLAGRLRLPAARLDLDTPLGHLGLDRFDRYVLLAALADLGVDTTDPGAPAIGRLGEAYERHVLAETWDPHPPSRATDLAGRFVHLRPLVAEDQAWATMFLTQRPLLGMSPLRGAVPDPAAVHQALWAGVLAQFVVLDRVADHPIGIVRAVGADHQAGSVLVELILDDDAGDGVLEGWMLLVDHLFTHWPFRRIRMEIPALVHQHISSADRWLLSEEGCLVAHHWHAGQFRDVLIRSLPRPVWEERKPILLPVGLNHGRGSILDLPTPAISPRGARPATR